MLQPIYAASHDFIPVLTELVLADIQKDKQFWDSYIKLNDSDNILNVIIEYFFNEDELKRPRLDLENIITVREVYFGTEYFIFVFFNDEYLHFTKNSSKIIRTRVMSKDVKYANIINLNSIISDLNERKADNIMQLIKQYYLYMFNDPRELDTEKYNYSSVLLSYLLFIYEELNIKRVFNSSCEFYFALQKEFGIGDFKPVILWLDEIINKVNERNYNFEYFKLESIFYNPEMYKVLNELKDDTGKFNIDRFLIVIYKVFNDPQGLSWRKSIREIMKSDDSDMEKFDKIFPEDAKVVEEPKRLLNELKDEQIKEVKEIIMKYIRDTIKKYPESVDIESEKEQEKLRIVAEQYARDMK